MKEEKTIIEEFIEKGANLEHERWANWQKYLHSLCKKNKDGSLTISKERVKHWEYEIATPYSKLPDELKEYDRKEVRKYLPLLEKLLKYEKEKWIEKTIDEVEKIIRADLGINYGYSGNEAWDWFQGELPPFEDYISHFKSRLKEKLKKLKVEEKTEDKSIKAWAIMPSFPNNKELERFPFLTENKQFMVYLTKAAAEKDNNKMDEIVVPCKIVFNKYLKKKKLKIKSKNPTTSAQ